MAKVDQETNKRRRDTKKTLLINHPGRRVTSTAIDSEEYALFVVEVNRSVVVDNVQ